MPVRENVQVAAGCGGRTSDAKQLAASEGPTCKLLPPGFQEAVRQDLPEMATLATVGKTATMVRKARGSTLKYSRSSFGVKEYWARRAAKLQLEVARARQLSGLAPHHFLQRLSAFTAEDLDNGLAMAKSECHPDT